jgi:Ni,Fe-hydrogenase maturation factor
MAMHHSRSTHGVAIGEVLRLAEQLQVLPQVVEIFAIDVSDCLPNGAMTPTVLQAAIEVEARILAEIREATYA